MTQAAPGEVIDGRYQLVRPLGAGGMGEVFMARRLSLGDLVAIKRLLPAQDTADNRARFLDEARAAAHIHHPNVVRVFDFGEPPGATPYLVMEYLDGPTLADELRARGRLPAAEALALFGPICAAVEAGHRRGVVHRDLKPANVILAGADDGTRVVKVLDFGLAVMDGATRRLTTPGTIVGTCCYMAPEQVAGLPAMPATDVFALGIILYELVTGVLPFDGDTQMATLFKISQGGFRPARELVAELPRAIDDAIATALQVDPARRPARPERLLALAGGATTGRLATGPVPVAVRTSGSAPTQVMSVDGVEPPAGRPVTGGARIAAATPRLDVFVGRGPELTRLDEAQREAAAGHRRILVVAGDDGAGRSRLTEAFGRRAASVGAVVLTGRFFDDGSAPPLHDAFVRMLGAGVDSGAAAVAAIALRAGSRPIVLTLDDVHLARRAELELIDHLHRELGPAGALIVCTVAASPLRRDAGGEVSRWLAAHVQRRVAVTLRLRPFGLAEVRAYLDAAFGVVHVRPRDLRRLDAAAGGSPFFLAETVRHLLAAGTIRRRDDEWVVEVPEDVEVPATVAALVEARVAALEPELVTVLELASAAGDHVRFDVLAATSGLGEERLDGLLERAVAEEILTAAGAAAGHDYRFASTLLRAALYRRASPRSRKRAHRRLLDALAGLPPGDAARAAADRASHHAALDEPAAALAAALAALTGALERGDADLAESALARSRDAVERLAAAGTPPPIADRARLDYLGGTLCVRIGRMGEARALLTRAGEQARRAADGALELDVLYELAQCQVALGDLDGAIAAAERVVAAAELRGDRLRAARGGLALSLALLRRGRLDDAGALARALIADESLPAAVRAWAHRNLAWVAVAQGGFAVAIADAELGLTLARGAGDPMVLWMAINARAAIASESGDPVLGRTLHEECLELARRASLRRSEAIALANIGEASIDLGEHERALECFREALSIFLDIEDRACEGDCRVNVGRALLAIGERAGAVAMLERGRELCEATGRVEYAAFALLHLGEARLGDGDAAGARTAIADARQRLDEIRSHLLWRAELGLAQVAVLDGDRERARYHGRRALEHVDAQRAQVAPGSTSSFDRLTRPVRDLLADLDGVRGA